MVRGAVAKTGHHYMRTEYGAEAWAQILAALPADDRVLLEHIDSVMHYPVSLDGSIFRALVEIQFHGDRALAEQGLRLGGAYQADALLDGVLQLFARFVSPQQAYRRAGRVIASVYSSEVVSKTVVLPTGQGGSVTIVGLGESDYIAPWHCGWVERSLTRFGAENARVTERAWEAGLNASDELIYDVRWD